MHGVAARVAGGGDDGADVEVGGRARAVEDDHVVGLAGVQGARVVPGRHRHRRHVRAPPPARMMRMAISPRFATSSFMLFSYYQVSMLGRFLWVRGGVLGMLLSPWAIQARVSAGSITSSTP